MRFYDKAATALRKIWDETGIQHVEEALLLALIAVVAITITTQLGIGVQDVFGRACEELATVDGAAATC